MTNLPHIYTILYNFLHLKNAIQVNVVWTAQPFYELENLSSTIKLNEQVNMAIRKIIKTDNGAVLAKRPPVRLWQKPQQSQNRTQVRLIINIREIISNPSQFALFDLHDFIVSCLEFYVFFYFC